MSKLICDYYTKGMTLGTYLKTVNINCDETGIQIYSNSISKIIFGGKLKDFVGQHSAMEGLVVSKLKPLHSHRTVVMIEGYHIEIWWV